MGRGPALAIGGPTATGKTRLAVAIAQRLGAELVNADSRQLARRLRVATATPTTSELRGVRCHLLDVCEPGHPPTVAGWLEKGRPVLAELASRRVPAIVVGGTGQYFRALRRGWDFGGVPPDPATRAQLDAQASTPQGLALLARELLERDPSIAVDLANPRRVVRALEIRRAGGSLSPARRTAPRQRLCMVVLDAERTLHRRWIEERVDLMFAGGALAAEVQRELGRGTPASDLLRAGIGYAEMLDLLAGRRDASSARAATLQRTRRYAKAQRTWFRGEPEATWLERRSPDDEAELADRVAAWFSEPGRRPG